MEVVIFWPEPTSGIAVSSLEAQCSGGIYRFVVPGTEPAISKNDRGSRQKSLEHNLLVFIMQIVLEQLVREGRERLYPSLTNPNWLVLRERRELFRGWLATLPEKLLDVLDVGGRIQPYRPLLAERLRRYIAVDIRPTPLVNVVARAEHLPFANNQFDLVTCTQVLEYIAEPGRVISEIHRVLKPGGILLLSVPAVFPCDSNEDCWRFMSPGVRVLLAPFQQVEIRSEGSSLTGLFRTIAIWMAMFTKPAIVRRLLQHTALPVLNLVAVCLSLIIQTNNDQFAANFSAFARK